MISLRRKTDPDWVAILDQDANAVERALLDAAPSKATTLDDVIPQLQDAEQAKVLAYWQRSRWAPATQTDVMNEMRRVFGQGPRWKRAKTQRPSKLPPLYPPDRGRE